MESKSCITDKPVFSTDNDKLQAQDYALALSRFRECPAYTLLYQFSPKDTGQSKVK